MTGTTTATLLERLAASPRATRSGRQSVARRRRRTFSRVPGAILDGSRKTRATVAVEILVRAAHSLDIARQPNPRQT